MFLTSMGIVKLHFKRVKMPIIQEDSKLVIYINATLYPFNNNYVGLIVILHCIYTSPGYLYYTFFTLLKYNLTIPILSHMD